MLYYETIQKAIDYIEEHLKEDISIIEIAEYVSFSVPHIYRLFKAVTGETIKVYILKRRLSCAARELKTCKRNIADLAYEYGFESHDVFTRAFIRIYNTSPSKYRSEVREIVFNKFIVDKEICKIERNNNMNYKIINKDKIIVIGMECEAKQWDADGAIGRLWSNFLNTVDKVKNTVVPNVMYGICEHESCGKDGFMYMAGIEVLEGAEVPEGMTRRVINSQKFVQAEIPEEIKTKDAYNETSEYIKKNGYVLGNNDELEVYEEMFQDPEYHTFKLLIPIK